MPVVCTQADRPALQSRRFAFFGLSTGSVTNRNAVERREAYVRQWLRLPDGARPIPASVEAQVLQDWIGSAQAQGGHFTAEIDIRQMLQIEDLRASYCLRAQGATLDIREGVTAEDLAQAAGGVAATVAGAATGNPGAIGAGVGALLGVGGSDPPPDPQDTAQSAPQTNTKTQPVSGVMAIALLAVAAGIGILLKRAM